MWGEKSIPIQFEKIIHSSDHGEKRKVEIVHTISEIIYFPPIENIDDCFW